MRKDNGRLAKWILQALTARLPFQVPFFEGQWLFFLSLLKSQSISPVNYLHRGFFFMLPQTNSLELQ